MIYLINVAMTNRLSAILTSETSGTRKKILNFTLRGVTLANGHWLTLHSFTLALAKWACSRIFRRMYHFYRPVPSINSFCLVADLSCNWPVTIGNKCYIYLTIVMECTCQWVCIGTQAYTKKEKQLNQNKKNWFDGLIFVLCIFLCGMTVK